MSAKTGIWSAIGALAGGVAGAAVGHYAAGTHRRMHYSAERNSPVADAMVTGGAIGAVFGAFLGGTVANDEPPPAQMPK
jgi:uncharacterized protein YcfJ